MQKTCCDALWLPSTPPEISLSETIVLKMQQCGMYTFYIQGHDPYEQKVRRAERGKDPVLKNKTCRFRTGQHKLRIDIPFSPQPCRYLKGNHYNGGSMHGSVL